MISLKRGCVLAALAASIVVGLSGCEAYEVSVVSEGGVDYLEAEAVEAGDTVWFFGFAPEFFDFQLDEVDGGPLLDADGNYVPAADGEAWVDDFTSIVPAFLTTYPETDPLSVDSYDGSLDCYSDPILRDGAPDTSEPVSNFCADYREFQAVLDGFEPYLAPFGPLTEDPSDVVGTVARLDLTEPQAYCGVTIMAMELPYTVAETNSIITDGGADIGEDYDVIGHLVSFVEEAEGASATNSYFIECDGGGGGGGERSSAAVQPALAKTGADSGAALWGSIVGGFLVVAGVGAVLVSRPRLTHN